MSSIQKSGTFTLGSHTVKRLGYGAMQLAGPHVFGPPRDRDAALAVLREAVSSGVDHIDTCDYYGPHVTNQIIRDALSPYPKDLVPSPRSARGAAAMRPGCRPIRLPNLSRPCMTTSGISDLRCWTSSICA